MTQHDLIALEVHDASIWEPTRILPLITTMQDWSYNALVLHQNDLLDACTQLRLSANYGVADLRLKKVRNKVAWLNRLTRELERIEARLFLEVKEPSYHDHALELFPDLSDENGCPDPTAPGWTAFCCEKTKEILLALPDLGGLIVNLSSPESRLSLPDHLAKTGHGFDPETWFDSMIAAFHEPLQKQGKALFVRDFSYTPDMQSGVLTAIKRCKGQVGASVKVSAHDYFPRFPENPVLQSISEPKLVEFEAFGEHTGWGVIPNCRVAELRQRMIGYRNSGACGLLVRISWEAITGADALGSLSAINVFALPKLARNDMPADQILRDWLSDAHGCTGEDARQAAELMLSSWDIPAASYWNDQVFPRHYCLPSTWQEGWVSMDTNGMGRRDLDLNISDHDPRLTETARAALFAEKEHSTAAATRLAQEADALAARLPKDLARLFASFQWLPPFARQFELATKATFYAARNTPGDRAHVTELQTQLMALANTIEADLAKSPNLPHHHHMLFDPEQTRAFAASLNTVRSRDPEKAHTTI